MRKTTSYSALVLLLAAVSALAEGPAAKANLPDAVEFMPKTTIVLEGSIPFANYKTWGDEEGVKVYMGTIEIDHVLWEHTFFDARVSYLGDISFERLSESNIGPGTKTTPCVSVSPVGFQVEWRDTKKFSPFWEGKADVFRCDVKALTNTAQTNFGFDNSVGVAINLGRGYFLRIRAGDIHISNGMTGRPNREASDGNPGTDFGKVAVGIQIPINPMKAFSKVGKAFGIHHKDKDYADLFDGQSR